MELSEAMRTQNACRYYRDEPVPDEVLSRAVELARFAPNGGNRGAVRFVFVRDPALRRQLGQWYLPLWREVSGAARAGAAAISAADGIPRAVRTGFSNTERTMSDGDQFAERFGDHPVIIVVCADLALVHPTDTSLDRLSIVGGGSVYPMAQNLCLALRDQGVGTALTTLLVAREPQVKELLGIPAHFATACHITAGYPARPFPRGLHRPEVPDLAFTDRFGVPLGSGCGEGLREDGAEDRQGEGEGRVVADQEG
jgi:nitroreductase